VRIGEKEASALR